MKEPVELEVEDEISLLSVICATCGIILLCAYILWGPDPRDTSEVKHEQQTETRQVHAEPTPTAEKVSYHSPQTYMDIGDFLNGRGPTQIYQQAKFVCARGYINRLGHG